MEKNNKVKELIILKRFFCSKNLREKFYMRLVIKIICSHVTNFIQYFDNIVNKIEVFRFLIETKVKHTYRYSSEY